MGSGWKVGRLAGIDISVHPSWLVIAFLITYSLAGSQFPRDFPGWSQDQYWGVSAVTAALFFASVLAHELSHAIVARRFGLKVEGITLFIFGGATTIDADSRTPREEALIAIAGPAASLLIGAALLVVGQIVTQPHIDGAIAWLGFVNIALGIFNLIPGFPMDGGRVLRALLWRVRGDRLVATRNAATVGRAFAYLLVGLGVFLALQPGAILGGLWLAVIGWFLSNAAEATLLQTTIDQGLSGVRVRDAMDPNPPSVSPNDSVAALVNERMAMDPERSYLVRHADGGLAGIVTLRDVTRLPKDDWPMARVTDVMTRFADLTTIGPDAPMADALRLLQGRLVGQLPVLEPDTRVPLGMVTRRGILRLIDARTRRRR